MYPKCLQVDVSLAATTEGQVEIIANAACHSVYRGGASVAALTAAAVSALTVYDMCKASSKSTIIEHITLRDA